MLLFLYIFLGLASAQDLQCQVQGECDGFLTGLAPHENYNDCLQFCKQESDCNWFTFNGDNNFCLKYENCSSVDNACLNCLSGQKECMLETATCNIQGFCEGFVVAYDTAQSVNECLRLCQQYDNCNWYTYMTESKACVLTEDCAILDESCSDCISGERICFEEIPVFDKLFLVGGLNGNARYKAEIVDLSGENKICPSIPDYPAAYGSVGTFIGDQALVCGGIPTTNDCYYYEPSNNSWVQTYSMLEKRAFFAAVQLSPTEWWVTGQTVSTEIYTVGGQGFSPYVDLPEGKSDHDLVQINSTHFMLVGGDPSSNSAWIFDRSLEEWIPIQNLQYGRTSSQAGLVEYLDGVQAVFVAGGTSDTISTEVFDLVSQRWQAGPELPMPISTGASVQYGDSFLVVGGYDYVDSDYLDSIYMYDTTEDNWIEMPQKLGVARGNFAAFLVPSDFIQCV